MLQYRILTKLINIKATTKKDLTNINLLLLCENIHYFWLP